MYNCLEACPHLEKVTIYQCRTHACGTEALRCLPKLQFLEIRVQCEDIDKFVEVNTFCFPEHISTLVLHLRGIIGVGLEKLFNSLTVLRSLTCLHLHHCGGIIDHLPLDLLHLRSLESLHLQNFNLAADWASDCSCLTKLTLLSFAGLDDPVPLHELVDLPALHTLHISGHWEPLHGDIVIDLDVLPDLPPTVRELRACRLTWVPEMSSLRGLANLRVCMLHGTGSVSLPAHMPHLQTLVLDCNDGLVLEDHLTGFTALRLLSLRACGQVAVPSAFHQLAALPHLTCIDVEGSLPVNQLDWSAYGGLPLHPGDVPGSLPMDNRPYLVYDEMIEY